MMDLMIVQNPWTKDPKALFNLLERQMKQVGGIDKTETVDHGALKRLKAKLAQSKNIKVK